MLGRIGGERQPRGPGAAEGRVHEQRVDVRVGADAVTPTIVDDGRPFDPTAHPRPSAPLSLAEASVGGRGIAMVRRASRGMRYRRVGGRNEVEVELARGR